MGIFTIIPHQTKVDNKTIDLNENKELEVKGGGFSHKSLGYITYYLLTQNLKFPLTDFILTDVLTTNTGVNNTIDTTNTDAVYKDTSYICKFQPDSSISTDTTICNMSNCSDAFNNDSSTSATYNITTSSSFTYYVGKTFNTLKQINKVYIHYYVTTNYGTVSLQGYDGTNWNTITNITTSTSYASYDGYITVNKELKGIRLQIYSQSGSSNTCNGNVYSFLYGDLINSKVILKSYSFNDDIKGLYIYTDYLKDENSNITIDITNGTNTITQTNVNTIIPLKEFSSKNLTITFNINTLNNLSTPKLNGYSIIGLL